MSPRSLAPAPAVGATFQISAGASNTIGQGSGFEFGDYTGLDFVNGKFHPAWTDNSSLAGNPDRPNTDVATARVTVNADGTRSVGGTVNVSKKVEYQAQPAIAVNPTNPNNLVTLAVDFSVSVGLLKAVSMDGGATWGTEVIATGTDTMAGGDGFPAACCDPSVAFDTFGNCFVAYVSFPDAGGTAIEILNSVDGGDTFTRLASVGSEDVDQPTIVTGPGSVSGTGSVWVSFKDFAAAGGAGAIMVSGASVASLGDVGTFADQEAPNSADGNFADLAVGPSGQIVVTYQDNVASEGPSTLWVHLDPDGLGTASSLGAGVAAATTNVGGFDYIPPQPNRSIDAEVGLAWDRSGSPNGGTLYMVYTDEPVDESGDTDIYLTASGDNGATWTAPIRVNGTATNSQFLPRIALDQTTGNFAITWLDGFRDTGAGAAVDTDGLANTDVVLAGTFSIAPPPAPGSLTATPQFGRKVRLTWSDVAGETAYLVRRSTDGTNFTDVATLGANVTSFLDSGLTPGTRYTYRVIATNAGGSSSPATTSVTVPNAPATPTNLNATAIAASKVRLTWTDNATGELDYRISRKIGTGAFVEFRTVAANTTIFVDSGLTAGVTYTYRVRARDAVDFSNFSNEAGATTPTLPAAPTNLTATAVSSSRIRLTWADNANNELSYRLSRKAGAGAYVEFRTLAANSTAFTDQGLTPGVTYTYRIRAYNTAGFSAFSNEAPATTPTPPAAPSNLDAVGTVTGRIRLTWADNSNNETAFVIERKGVGGSYAAIRSVPAGTTSFLDTGLVSRATYTYRVRAQNIGGFSAYSNEDTAVAP